MPRVTQTREFGEEGSKLVYKCTPLPPLAASRLLTYLTQVLGGTLVPILSNVMGDDPTVGVMDALRYIAYDGLEKLTPEAHDHIILTLCSCVQPASIGEKETIGALAAFDAHFSERGLDEAYRVILWVLEVHFRAYFAGALSRLSTRAGAAKDSESLADGISSTSSQS